MFGNDKVIQPSYTKRRFIFSINDVDLNKFSTFIKGGDLKDSIRIKPNTFKAWIIRTNFISQIKEKSKIVSKVNFSWNGDNCIHCLIYLFLQIYSPVKLNFFLYVDKKLWMLSIVHYKVVCRGPSQIIFTKLESFDRTCNINW